MRSILLFIAAILLIPTVAGAQSPPAKDLKSLFDAVQRLGVDDELRGDISDRLGLGEDPILVKDLVVKTNGVQRSLNAFVVDDKAYILFDTHLYAPEIYIFVKNIDGALVASIHGQQFKPINTTTDMKQSDAAPLVGAEEAFWFQWLANGAKVSAPAK